MHPKITPDHLGRGAVVYIRQSTIGQVAEHTESQRRQYALADSARACGFASVTVIDDDLGRSGSGLVERPGFQKLVASVCSGSAGAVFCIEASRLARNGRDWHHLIDLCALVGTLVIDPDGTYDPRLVNDRLLLGLKGTMSEYELSLAGCGKKPLCGAICRAVMRKSRASCRESVNGTGYCVEFGGFAVAEQTLGRVWPRLRHRPTSLVNRTRLHAVAVRVNIQPTRARPR